MLKSLRVNDPPANGGEVASSDEPSSPQRAAETASDPASAVSAEPEAAEPISQESTPPLDRGYTSQRKLIASSMDAIVRSAKLKLPNLIQLAQRTTEALRASPGIRLEIQPTALVVEGEVQLEATDTQGNWLLPAFMAGLRRLEARRQVTEEDLLRLAVELAMLEPTASSVEQFRDWLWAEGAEGFSVSLHQSFVEAMDAITTADEHRSPYYFTEQQAYAAITQGGVLVPVRELEAASRRSEAQLRLDSFTARLGREAYKLEEPTRDSLKQRCDNAADWSAAEIDVALARAELQGAVSPARLALRILARSVARVDASLLLLLTEFFQAVDAHKTAVAAVLQRHNVGTTIAQALDLDDPGVPAMLATFLRTVPRSIGADTLCGLLERSPAEPDVSALLRELFGSAQADSVLARLNMRELSGQAAMALARIVWTLASRERDDKTASLPYGALSTGKRSFAQAASADPHVQDAVVEVASVLAAVSPVTAVAILLDMPPPLVVAFRAQIKNLLVESQPEVMTETVLLLTRDDVNHGSGWGMRVLAEVLAVTRGRGWPKEALHATFAAFLDTGFGERTVLPMVSGRRTPVHLRIAALEALRLRPELLVIAAAKRPMELLEPAEMRAALEKARAFLKELGLW
ncbi:hypothetical protein ACFL59_09635 [Planctomycetota bacterium]